MRCQALDSQALQCPNHNAKPYYYHGDPELYTKSIALRSSPYRSQYTNEIGEPSWVLGYFCDDHKPEGVKFAITPLKTKSGLLWHDGDDIKSPFWKERLQILNKEKAP